MSVKKALDDSWAVFADVFLDSLDSLMGTGVWRSFTPIARASVRMTVKGDLDGVYRRYDDGIFRRLDKLRYTDITKRVPFEGTRVFLFDGGGVRGGMRPDVSAGILVDLERAGFGMIRSDE